MKNIVLMPVRNEAWIIRETLENISAWADHIIIADQQSTDATRDIIKKFPKATIVENNATGHSNAVRWLLLEEARKITPQSRIWCLDADEQIPHSAIQHIISTTEKYPMNTGFSLDWIQIWKNPQTIRTDWPWSDNHKACIWIDDSTASYDRTMVLNDHTNRIPVQSIIHIQESLFHLQFLAWQRSQTKQIWYQMRELDAGIKSAFRINRAYIVSKDGSWVKTLPSRTHNIEGIIFPHETQCSQDDTERRSDIQKLIHKRGVAFFTPLNVWHDETLCRQYKKHLGFYPKQRIIEKIILTGELTLRNFLT
jgi:glycosyltransferase involved in cell wall biosynthesis